MYVPGNHTDLHLYCVHVHSTCIYVGAKKDDGVLNDYRSSVPAASSKVHTLVDTILYICNYDFLQARDRKASCKYMYNYCFFMQACP